MKKKRLITLLAVAGLVFALAPAAQAVILSDGHTGDYRIIFTTDGTFGAKDTTIGPYNNFVSGQAAADANLSLLGATWTAVGSTELTSARTNTGTIGTGADIHIYTPTTTAGSFQLVATDYDALWNAASVDLLAPIRYGDGAASKPAGHNNSDQIWTGTNPNGSIATSGDGLFLGSITIAGDGTGNIRLSRGDGDVNQNWISGVSDHDGSRDPSFPSANIYDKHFMGISGVLSPAAEVVPEPASIAIWSFLGICLAGYGYRRRRRNS
jgi:hypothetical protein